MNTTTKNQSAFADALAIVGAGGAIAANTNSFKTNMLASKASNSTFEKYDTVVNDRTVNIYAVYRSSNGIDSRVLVNRYYT